MYFVGTWFSSHYPLIDMGTIDYNHENMLEFHEVPDQQIIITIDTLNVDLTL